MKKLLWFSVGFVGLLQAASIQLVPLSGSNNPAHFFDRNARDDCMKAVCDLKVALSKFGYELQATTLEQAFQNKDKTIVFDAPCTFSEGHDPSNWFLFLWEPPTVIMQTYNPYYHSYFSKVFTLFDKLYTSNQVKFYFPQPSLKMIEELVPFKQKKLCTLIACNKCSPHPWELYSHRAGVISYFESNAPEEFDFYGIGWDSQKFKTYKGAVDHKVPYLKKYKFSFCYENMLNDAGYITEKIFDSFVAGCVPIYLGAVNISSYIPDNCFIAREKFSSLSQLHDFLKNMTEEDYNTYLENIRIFLSSKEAFLFSIEFFIDLVIEMLIPGYDQSVLFSQEQREKINQSKKIYAKRHDTISVACL